jgi:hypothetical protein
MPISNPILQGLTVVQSTEITLADSDPILAPVEPKTFWFNYAAKTLFLATATNSVADWIAIAGSSANSVTDWIDIQNKPATFPVDVANILSKILVEDGQVLTTDDNVIFED